MTSAAGPPPGWYDDPELVNTRRYWNGTAWTEHRQEQQDRPVPFTAPSPAAKRRSRWGKRTLIGGLAFLVVMLVVTFVMQASGDPSVVRFGGALWTTSLLVGALVMVAGAITWLVESSRS